MSRKKEKEEPAFGNRALRDQLSKWKEQAKVEPAPAPAKPPPRAVHYAPPAPAKTTRRAAEPPPRSPIDDESLFHAAMEEVVPIRPKGAHASEPPRPTRTIQQVNEDAEALAALAELVATGEGLDLADTDEYVEGLARDVDPRVLEALRRGDFSVQGHVDLHGLGADAARDELERFLTESRRRGHRCVLVVHGRGLHSKDQIPIIKTRMQAWLQRGRLSRIVLAFATARPVDGGAGALYVLLRR